MMQCVKFTKRVHVRSGIRDNASELSVRAFEWTAPEGTRLEGYRGREGREREREKREREREQ